MADTSCCCVACKRGGEAYTDSKWKHTDKFARMMSHGDLCIMSYMHHVILGAFLLFWNTELYSDFLPAAKIQSTVASWKDQAE